ncbi:tripartite tricarboxylate transporter substrate binding protein [Limnohabitans radicicola]|uniref:Tripartite tricarboxylate transporter substrate binding protein n=1 Tax=Limnohabitans radicicola TaxID=2771427 RepID=A0A927FIG6_9BURK|nr:tripartite tricarboxylate transporter substrate binding protein [Limnohabitans radicicola]MBD8050185.1 tripartite tricarboxylate transporter substrate binding protein [Limnohabitans radicicola]
MNKRKALAALVWALVGTGVHAQSTAPYPNKPVKLLVGFAPGGAADHVARSMNDAFGRALGTSVVVENRAGAGSSIAAEIVAKAPADGYTVLIASPSSISVNPALNPKLGYSPKDLAPVTKITTSPLVIAVNPNIGINSLQDLMARAKKEPGRINYATSGNGSAPHLGGALFTQLANVDLTHIPFRGGGPAIQSLIAGDTQVTFGTPPSVLPMIQAGRLKGLAVSTTERTPLVPGVPGMREAGLPEYSIEFWYGIFVPAATPAPVVKKIYEAAQWAMGQPNVKAALAREGTDVDLSKSPEQFAAFLQEDAKFWVKLVKNAGVKLD